MSSRTRTESLNASHTQVRHLATTMDLTLALADLDHAAPLARRAFKRMQDARPGLPGAQAYDAPTVSGGSSMLTHPERIASQHDRTEADRILLDRTLEHLWFLVRPDAATLDDDKVTRQITADCLTLRRLIDAWTPRTPTDRDRRQVRAENVAATECALTREHLGLWAQPVATSNLYGLLPEPVPVCLWLRRFAHDHRRLPTPMEWKRHASTDDDLRSQLIGSVKA